VTFARIVPKERLNAMREVFRAWFECSECQTHVDLADRYCRSCGVKFWSPNERSVS